jgi:hypothetical protein
VIRVERPVACSAVRARGWLQLSFESFDVHSEDVTTY